MKNVIKILALAVFGLFLTVSCERTTTTEDYVDNDTYSEVLELKNINFTKNTSTGVWEIYRTFNTALYASDQVLVYRQNGTNSAGSPIWQLIPRTLYLTQGELDYDFDFSKNDVLIKAGGTYDLATTPAYINNQTFRVVIVPGYFGKNASLNVEDYDAVIKFYNLNDKNPKQL